MSVVFHERELLKQNPSAGPCLLVTPRTHPVRNSKLNQPDADPQIEYARQMLLLNPLEEAEQILDRRLRYKQPKTSKQQSSVEHHADLAQKELVSEQLDKLRAAFWSLDDRKLKQRLNAIDTKPFPHLSIIHSKLKSVAECRDQFQQLKAHPRCFPEFYDKFCKLVIAPPAKAVALRMKYLEESRRGLMSPRFPKPKKYRQLAHVIKKEFPQLYELEKVWINQLLAKRNRISTLDNFYWAMNKVVYGITYLIVMLTLGFIIVYGLDFLTKLLSYLD
ncbi:hypothetical protein Pan110_47420 [Gimesia panareensis]|nr:hypothetical protein Pan110_47420 [Gimesia panareensis]